MRKYTFETSMKNFCIKEIMNAFLGMLNDEKMENEDFDEDKYVWYVGVNVFQRLRSLAYMLSGHLWDRGKDTFLGISMRVVYTNPNTIVFEKKHFVDQNSIRPVCSNIPEVMSYFDTDMACDITDIKKNLNAQYGRLAMQVNALKEEEKIMNTPLDRKSLTYAAQDAIDTYRVFAEYLKHRSRKPEDPIKKVIFNDPATIVFWKDGLKTVVMAENEPFDPEKGLAMAIAKRSLGNKGNYYDIFRKHLPEEKPEKPAQDEKEPCLVELLTSKQLAEKLNMSISTVLKNCRIGIYPRAMKVNGKWFIPKSDISGGDK